MKLMNGKLIFIKKKFLLHCQSVSDCNRLSQGWVGNKVGVVSEILLALVP